jgi:LmbE family N-acetylglucosaminyl deacetylase
VTTLSSTPEIVELDHREREDASPKPSSEAGRPLVVVSPHCDDAVFGCGELLADRPGSAVITVFAGRPDRGRPLTRWDAAAGFGEGDDVMGCRHAEDRAALAVLGARARWLPFRDAQYGGPLGADAVVAELAAAVRACRPDVVAIPLGLFHDDHKTTHEAGLRLARRWPQVTWLLYADALYRRIAGLVEERLARLRDAGLGAEPLPPPGAERAELKRRAVACYASQLRALSSDGLGGPADVFEPEGYWRLRT